MQKKNSVADELKKLGKLKGKGLITEVEFEMAKKKILGVEEIADEEKPESQGLKRKATAFDVMAPIIIIFCVIILQGGLLGGAILGVILGLLMIVTSKMTSSIIGRIIIFIILSSILTFTVAKIAYPATDDDITSTTNNTIGANTSLVDYQNCISSVYEAYLTRWNKTCNDLGKQENCFLPNETVSNYDDSLQNEKDRCATQYASKIPNSLESYNSCRTSAYDVYTERWNMACKELGKSEDCSLPSASSENYEQTRERELNRCIVLYQQ